MTMPISIIVVIAALGLVSHVIPSLKRPDLYFAVTVNPSFRSTAEGSRILRRYRIGVWISTLLGTLIVAFTAKATSAASFALGSLLLVIVVQSFLFVLATSAVSPNAVPVTGIREAGLTPRESGLPGGPIVSAGPFVLLAALALQAYVEFGPPTAGLHIAFEPTWLAAPSAATVYGLLLLLGLVCVVLFTVEVALSKGMRLVNASGLPAAMEFRSQRVTGFLLVGLQYLLVFLAWLSITTSMSSATKEEVMVGWQCTMLVMVTGAIIAAVWYNKRASSYLKTPDYWLNQLVTSKGPEISSGATSGKPAPQPATPRQEQAVGDRTPDRCWKWGQFYYNPDDPAIIVEKRRGIGQTLNFGNAWAWVLLAILLAVSIVIVAH